MKYDVYYQRFFGLLQPAEVKAAWLPLTHRLVTAVWAGSLDAVYRQLQAENWSPHGEARPLIARLHLSHTSLSAGDVVRAENGYYWVCNWVGWTLLNTPELAPWSLWLSSEADFKQNPPQVTRLKITGDPDCLPAEAFTVEQFGAIAFSELVVLARLIEQRLGLRVCIDLGDEFYETESHDESDQNHPGRSDLRGGGDRTGHPARLV